MAASAHPAHRVEMRHYHAFATLLILVACGSETPTSDAGRADGSLGDAGADGSASDAGLLAPSCGAPFADAAPPPAVVPLCATPLPSTPSAVLVESLSEGVVVHRNLSIAMRGGVSLEGDLFVPPAASGLLIIVHGGGWLDCMNRRDTMSLYGELIARTLGIATFNVEYRLAQEGGGYPENVMDVICAVQWAHGHVADYGIDDRVGMVGTSAGAHLALMAGLVGARADLDPGCGADASLDLVLAYAAPTDLPALVAGPSEAREAPRLYTAEPCDVAVGGCLADRRGCTRCVDASPVAHACTATAPIVLLQAPDPYDPLVPEAQARVMAAALEANGADVTLVIPTDAEMRASGCTPEGHSHALDGCMLMAGGPIVNPLLRARLGPR